LRAFTTYEFSLDALFFHYVTGGSTLAGKTAETHLVTQDETIARRIVKNGNKFLSWAKPGQIREQASTFMKNGWPISDILSTRTHELADCERIRNRIAHNSTEAVSAFNTVQRNLFYTESLFAISPGQLLRAKHKTHKRSHLARYIDVMSETIATIVEPPTI
jgi:hypothetical protein